MNELWLVPVNFATLVNYTTNSNRKILQTDLKHKLSIFYKMTNNISHISITAHPRTNTRYNLRTKNSIQQLPRTQLYKDSFLPSVIRDWNILAYVIKNHHQSLSSNAIITPISDNNRLSTSNVQVLLNRLRLGCSSLNNKYKHTFLPLVDLIRSLHLDYHNVF